MHFESSRAKSDEERVLPLINVVFLLLIFIMLGGRLTMSDPFRVEPPRSLSDAAAHHRDMNILIGAGGRLAVDGRIVERADLRSEVTRRVSRDATLRVLVRADGRAEAIRVISVMEILSEAGIGSLKLLTLPEAR